MITGEERLGIDMGEHDLGSRNEGGRCHVIDGPDNRGSPLPQLVVVQTLKDWGLNPGNHWRQSLFCTFLVSPQPRLEE